MGCMIRLGLMMLFLLAIFGATLWIYFNAGMSERTEHTPTKHSLTLTIHQPLLATVKRPSLRY